MLGEYKMENLLTKETAIKLVAHYGARNDIATFKETVQLMRENYNSISGMEKVGLERVERELEGFL